MFLKSVRSGNSYFIPQMRVGCICSPVWSLNSAIDNRFLHSTNALKGGKVVGLFLLYCTLNFCEGDTQPEFFSVILHPRPAMWHPYVLSVSFWFVLPGYSWKCSFCLCLVTVSMDGLELPFCLVQHHHQVRAHLLSWISVSNIIKVHY